MTDLGSRTSEDSDYREHEIRTGHIHEDEEADLEAEEEEQDEPDYEYQEQEDTGRESIEIMQLDKMKELILQMQVALKRKDIELLQSKKQNMELLTELERISEQLMGDQDKDADQISKVKQYEDEFMLIQKGISN